MVNDKVDYYKYSYRTDKESAKHLKLFAVKRNLTINELFDLALTEFINRYKDPEEFKNFKVYKFRADKRAEKKGE